MEKARVRRTFSAKEYYIKKEVEVVFMSTEPCKDGEILSGTEEDLMKVNFNSDDFAFLPGLKQTNKLIINASHKYESYN